MIFPANPGIWWGNRSREMMCAAGRLCLPLPPQAPFLLRLLRFFTLPRCLSSHTQPRNVVVSRVTHDLPSYPQAEQNVHHARKAVLLGCVGVGAVFCGDASSAGAYMAQAQIHLKDCFDALLPEVHSTILHFRAAFFLFFSPFGTCEGFKRAVDRLFIFQP